MKEGTCHQLQLCDSFIFWMTVELFGSEQRNRSGFGCTDGCCRWQQFIADFGLLMGRVEDKKNTENQ